MLLSKNPLEFELCEFASAMARSNPLDLPLVFEIVDNLGGLLITDVDQMQSTGNRINPWIDFGCDRQDFLDPRMGAADDDSQAFRRFDSQRQFVELQGPLLIGNRPEQEKPRGDLPDFIDPRDIGFGPRRIDWIGVGVFAAEVMQIFRDAFHISSNHFAKGAGA